LSTVWGEYRCRKTRCSSSQTVVVPFGDSAGVPDRGDEAQALFPDDALHVLG
jgi:hypothetical protein